MNETKKLNEYRIQNNYDNYFKGNGIDIGCGSDILSKSVFQNINSVIPYDKSLDDNNNALHCVNLKNEEFDFVYSSHCLEHIIDPYEAFSNWLRICKPLGYLIVAVPHEIFYEKYKWPSIYNPDHKTSWSLEFKSNLPNSIDVMDFLKHFDKDVSLISCKTIIENFDFNRFYEDQTRENAICQIEFIVRKN